MTRTPAISGRTPPRKPRTRLAQWDPLFIQGPLCTFQSRYYLGRLMRLEAGHIPPRVRLKGVPG